MSKYGVLSGPYFPVFGLNTEIYGVNLRIHCEYRKYGAEKNPYFETFHVVTVLKSKNTQDQRKKIVTIDNLK